jgi:hypothetical protein
MTDDPLVLQITAIEVAQLAALVTQFADLVADPDTGDDALERLVPDAYPDDADAGSEFSRLTRGDLLERRADEAAVFLRTLGADVPAMDALDEDTAAEIRTIALTRDDAAAWMRTLAAVRLILATRLGIRTEADSAVDDPRFVLYEWLGGILDALVGALDERL